MAAFAAEVELTSAAGAGNFALGKFHPEIDQFRDARRSLLNDGAHHVFPAQARAGFERVAHVHLDGIFLAGDRGDAALGVVRVRFRAVLLGDDGHAPAAGHLEGEGQSSHPAADHQVIEIPDRIVHMI